MIAENGSGGNAPPLDPPFLALITGGRDYADRDAVFRALDSLAAKHPNISIIHGACCERDDPTKLTGADRWAQEWAQTRQRPYTGVPAKWLKRGNGAGPHRNGIMVHMLPNGVVAFPSKGTGTANCVKQAADAGLKAWWPAGRGA